MPGPVPFYLCRTPMPAGLAVSHEWLIKSIRETIGDVSLGLIVIDTLNWSSRALRATMEIWRHISKRQTFLRKRSTVSC